MKNTILQILINSSYPILFYLIIIISIRIVYLIKNKLKILLINDLITLTFIIYIVCLYYIISHDAIRYSNLNLSIFKEIFRYQIGSILFIKNVVGNILLFIPFGIYVSYYLKLKTPLLLMIVSFIVSLMIETIQLNIGRTFDIDDIILNMIGSIIGGLIYIFFKKTGKLFCTGKFDRSEK